RKAAQLVKQGAERLWFHEMVLLAGTLANRRFNGPGWPPPRARRERRAKARPAPGIRRSAADAPPPTGHAPPRAGAKPLGTQPAPGHVHTERSARAATARRRP